jgi:hypothetical protein
VIQHVAYSAPSEAARFRTGDAPPAAGARVGHRVLGDGTVLDNDDPHCVLIVFDRHGRKLLSWTFARSNLWRL